MIELFIVWGIAAGLLMAINVAMISTYKVKAEMGFVFMGCLLIIPGLIAPFFVRGVSDG